MTTNGKTEVCVRCGLGWADGPHEQAPQGHATTPKGPMHFRCAWQWRQELQR